MLKYFTILVLIVLLAIASVFLGYFEQIETTYDSYYDIGEDMKRGWIPATIPRTSKNIYEKHDLDTNEIWLKFKAPTSDIQKFIAQEKYTIVALGYNIKKLVSSNPDIKELKIYTINKESSLYKKLHNSRVSYLFINKYEGFSFAKYYSKRIYKQ